MADTILVVVEQREGKLNRASWETLTGAQALAAETEWTLEAAVVGSGVGDVASEVAAKKVAKVYDIESSKLEPYTPDGFVAALKGFVEKQQPKLVLMPRTRTRSAILLPSWRLRLAGHSSAMRSATSTRAASCCSRDRCSRASLSRMCHSRATLRTSRRSKRGLIAETKWKTAALLPRLKL